LVEAFPGFVEAVYSRCPDAEAQRVLGQNAQEERTHPELWLRFAESIGLSRREVVQSRLLPETAASLDILGDLTHNGSHLEGAAALWAYESQVPLVSERKIDGLERFYGISDPRGLEFFEVHRSVDVAHAAAERRILEAGALTPDAQRGVRAAVERSLAALWALLDGVYREHVAN
jgi:pyrroloquinoline-quinone synthase